MRSFAAIPPVVWQMDIKKLRGDPTAIAVYYHLTTSPHSTMIGIYALDLHYLSIDLGIPFEGASKGLRRVIEEGLASYDEEHEIVWVHEMAISQVAPRLSPKDNRVLAVAKQLAQLPICQITLAFYARYRDVFNLRDALCLEDFERSSGRGFEGASEGLRSKEKEKEKDQDLGEGQNKIRFDDERLVPTREAFDAQEFAFEPKPSLEENRKFLVQMGVPAHRMETALQRLIREALFPCDIAEWKTEVRNGRAA
ncbi:hypothetical protein GTW51_18960 [Aurantimonas aggregata]|uniref:Uncharacterized protein n=1 Tax=Aurantimonas aggregata TaxID=2047720 RepID=A0A6L9MLQ2_9HYPH|nr:hypothetical protein [Aurantimonas aggregata]NDV88779.1 hypothetical protein [Aurantimonas aggregata]